MHYILRIPRQERSDLALPPKQQKTKKSRKIEINITSNTDPKPLIDCSLSELGSLTTEMVLDDLVVFRGENMSIVTTP